MDKHNSVKGFATRQIHEGALHIPGIAPLAMPIFQTSTFVFENTTQGADRFSGNEEGYIYTRLGNPNATQVAQKIANLENAQAALVAGSGMGAITTAIWTIMVNGGHILADRTLYGCTYAFLEHGISRYGIDVSMVDFSNAQAVRDALRPDTKVVYFETPANPDLKIIDIELVSEIAHKYNPNIKVIVDNTFCTPYLQLPLECGADVVVHSATKYLNGHGDVIAGMVVGNKEFIDECNMFGLKDMTGAVVGPFEAYLIARGMKTLDIRMKRHCENAMAVAEFLEADKRVSSIAYPGLKSHPRHEVAKKQMRMPGGMITFELDTTREKTEEFINSLELCTIAVSLGDAETLIEHPASMTHSTYGEEALLAVGITPKMIRLSVGLEDADDIIYDLKKTMDRVFR